MQAITPFFCLRDRFNEFIFLLSTTLVHCKTKHTMQEETSGMYWLKIKERILFLNRIFLKFYLRETSSWRKWIENNSKLLHVNTKISFVVTIKICMSLVPLPNYRQLSRVLREQLFPIPISRSHSRLKKTNSHSRIPIPVKIILFPFP